MKSFLVVCVAFIVVVSGAYLPVDNNLENLNTYISEIMMAQNDLAQLIREDLYILSKFLNYYEPFLIPYMPEQHFEGKDFDGDVELKEVKISATDNYTVDYTKMNNKGLGVDFSFTIPKVHLEGQYKVSGVFRQTKVNGDGNFTVDIDKLVLTGTIQLTNGRPYPKVKEIDVNYDLKGLKTKLDGLSIEGMMKEQMTDLVNNTFYEYLQWSKNDVWDVMREQLVQAVTKSLEVEQMINAYSKLFSAH